jgi:hypothetical protein
LKLGVAGFGWNHFIDSCVSTIIVEGATAMPTVRVPDAPPDPKAPLCPECGKHMRLEGSEPSMIYVNLDQLNYVCDCGQTSDRQFRSE